MFKHSLKISLHIPKRFNAFQVLKWFLLLLEVTCVISVRTTNTDVWHAIVARATKSRKNCSKPPKVHSGQTTGDACDLSTSGHFPVSSHKISTVNLCHSSLLGTKSNDSPSLNVLLPSFTALTTSFFIWKSAPRETDDNNYHDYNTSLHISLRTRKFRQEKSLLLQR